MFISSDDEMYQESRRFQKINNRGSSGLAAHKTAEEIEQENKAKEKEDQLA